MITGYVGYGLKSKYSNLITLYLQTVFYAFLSVLLYWIFKPEVITLKSIICAIFPFASSGGYWYFGAYFTMFFFIPVLNKGVELCEKKYLDIYIVFVLVFFSIFNLFISVQSYNISNGYSFIWLMVMYIVGAYFKKYDIANKISNIKCIAVYSLMVVAAFVLKLAWEYYGLKTTGEFVVKGGLFLQYNALPFLVCAMALLLVFAKMNVKGAFRKAVMFLSPLSFGIYICHVSDFSWGEILTDLFTGVTKLSPVLFVLGVFGAILSVYLVSAVIEFVRSKLFELLRVKKFSIWLEEFITKIISKAFSLLDR